VVFHDGSHSQSKTCRHLSGRFRIRCRASVSIRKELFAIYVIEPPDRPPTGHGRIKERTPRLDTAGVPYN